MTLTILWLQNIWTKIYNLYTVLREEIYTSIYTPTALSSPYLTVQNMSKWYFHIYNLHCNSYGGFTNFFFSMHQSCIIHINTENVSTLMFIMEKNVKSNEIASPYLYNVGQTYSCLNWMIVMSIMFKMTAKLLTMMQCLKMMTVNDFDGNRWWKWWVHCEMMMMVMWKMMN